MVKQKQIARQDQAGIMLLEALLAILIFSIGVLAVIGMQTASIKAVSDAKYRADAAFLANQVIGEMWLDRPNLGSYAYSSGTPPSSITAWVNKVQATLPGAATNNPTIVIGANNLVTVTVRWQPPRTGSNQAANIHNHVVVASIN